MTSSGDMDCTQTHLTSGLREAQPPTNSTGHFENPVHLPSYGDIDIETPSPTSGVKETLPPTHFSDHISTSNQPPANEPIPPSSSPFPPDSDPCWTQAIFHRSNSFKDRNIKQAQNHDLANEKKNIWLTLSSYPPALICCLLLLFLYVLLAILIHALNPKGFSGFVTHPIVDTLYFHVVSVCTAGYGDIVPLTSSTKIMSCLFALIGVGIINTLFSSFISLILDLQKRLLRDYGVHRVAAYAFDFKTGQMKIHAYVGFIFIIFTVLVALGVVGIQFLEKLKLIDSLYLAIMSVTTMGYGDFSFKNISGRIFAIIWLPFSTFLVGVTYLVIVPTIIKRHNQQSVLQRPFALRDFTLVGMNHEGHVREADYILHALLVSEAISEEDILRCRGMFRELDPCNMGWIALKDNAVQV
ncbi:Two-pore potassium channel 5 [Platanthera zijinensis]|uniref:Two-pore potassium channel 5 n=1 Tax=Platanthera zijinensis TaxID=2320716 RepID=A0AAP0G7V8_9ASPA